MAGNCVIASVSHVKLDVAKCAAPKSAFGLPLEMPGCSQPGCSQSKCSQYGCPPTSIPPYAGSRCFPKCRCKQDRQYPNGAYRPYKPCPRHVQPQSWSRLSSPEKLSDTERAALSAVQQLLNYLKENVSQFDKKALKDLTLSERTMLSAQQEGIRSKGCHSYLKAVDTAISVATHLLTQHPSIQVQNALKQLLLQICSSPYLTDSAVLPHEPSRRKIPTRSLSPLDNIRRNIAIISKILGIDFLGTF
ncbi:MAG: hypothetical protein LBF34_04295 [Puniceicoccales bacterium]|nr:hypothetical protein [Puniceicoccales bacterium]